MSDRLRRVDEAVKEVLSEGIGELKDPRIGFVTITGVETSSDLRHARVFVSVLGSEQKRERTLDGLAAAHQTGERVACSFQRHDLAFDADELERLPAQVALRAVEEPLELVVTPRDAGEGESRALPDVVVVDLRHRRAEPVLELRLRGADEPPLPLQRACLREV